jgi:hypothetical protein
VIPGSLLAARDVQKREVPASDEVTPVRKKAVEFEQESAAAAAGVVAAAPSHCVAAAAADSEPGEADGPAGETEAAVVRYVKQSGYFERMLLYEPIPLLQLQEDLRANAGVKMSRQRLAAFLDSRGVDFLNPDSKWK